MTFIHAVCKLSVLESRKAHRLLTSVIAVVPFGIFAILQNSNLPMQVQPQISCALSLLTSAHILQYKNGLSTFRASIFATFTGVMFACVEMLLRLTLRPLYDRGMNW